MSEQDDLAPKPIEVDSPFPPVLHSNSLVSLLASEAARQAKMKAEGKPLGPVTGFDSLDKAIGGYLQPGVHFLAAPPGSGKTALALQMAMSSGFPWVFVSLEMSPLVLAQRMVARLSETFYGAILRGEFSPEQMEEKARSAFDKLANPFSIIDGTSKAVSLDFMAHAVRNRGNGGPCLLILDYLQLWAKSTYSGVSAYDALGQALPDLKAFAKRYQLPLLAIASQNNEGQRVKDGSSDLCGLRDSGEIGYFAETVMSLRMTGKDDEECPFRDCEVSLPKNRYGQANRKLKLIFEGRLQRFLNPQGAAR